MASKVRVYRKERSDGVMMVTVNQRLKEMHHEILTLLLVLLHLLGWDKLRFYHFD